MTRIILKKYIKKKQEEDQRKENSTGPCREHYNADDSIPIVAPTRKLKAEVSTNLHVLRGSFIIYRDFCGKKIK